MESCHTWVWYLGCVTIGASITLSCCWLIRFIYIAHHVNKEMYPDGVLSDYGNRKSQLSSEIARIDNRISISPSWLHNPSWVYDEIVVLKTRMDALESKGKKR